MNCKPESRLSDNRNVFKSRHSNLLTKQSVVTVNDSKIIDGGVPTSEVYVSSSNKRKATNDISTVTSTSSQFPSRTVDTDIVPIAHDIQIVLTNRFYRATRKTQLFSKPIWI